MSPVATATPGNVSVTNGHLLMAGILLAALTEALAGTVLSLGRSDIIGDTYATPDEFAWLDIGYTAFKLIGFVTAPWLVNRFAPRQVLISATLVMAATAHARPMTKVALMRT